MAGEFPSGSTLRQGETGWVLVEHARLGLGSALIWARSQGLSQLHLLVEAGPAAEVLARRAGYFRSQPRVWAVTGRQLSPAEPRGPEPEAGAPEEHLALAPELAATGAEVVVEHGQVLAEVRGLEVARVEAGPEGPLLRVGVGRHDREARTLLIGTGQPGQWAALAQVVADVRRRRQVGAPVHPAYTLAPERWLRSVLIAIPALVGARQLQAVSPPEARPDLLGRSPAPARGTEEEGGALVVVCSTGIDPELVPLAAEVRERELGPSSAGSLALVVPEGDDHPLFHGLLADLVEPGELRTVPADWRALSA